MNKFIGLGRITKDLEIFKTTSDMSILKFTIAINRNKDVSDFINCISFKETADNIVKYFKKGSLIGIEGSVQTGSYEKDGKKVYTTEIAVSRWYFTGEKATTTSTAETDEDTEYLPF